MPIGYQPGIVIAPPWSPLQLSGLRGFWQADQGISLSGANITQWNDQTVYANNLTVDSGNTVFNSTGFNGNRPAATLASGAGSTLAKSGVTGWDATGMFSIFVLVQFASVGGFGAICGMRVSNADTTNGTVIGVDAGNLALTQDRATAALFGNGEFSAPAGDYLLIATRDGAGLCHFYMNNAEQGTANSIAFSYTPAHWEFGSFIGMLGNISCQVPFWGITSVAMNQDQRNMLRRYSIDTWGATI